MIDSLEHEDENDRAQIPTSITALQHQPNQIVSGYRNGDVVLFDIEKGTPVSELRGPNPQWISALCAHPTSSLVFTGSKDNSIQYFDLKTVWYITKNISLTFQRGT